MHYDEQTLLNIREFFFALIKRSISPSMAIFSLYVLLCLVFIVHIPFKHIISGLVAIIFVYTIYLLIFDITYVQFIYSLHIDEQIRILMSQMSILPKISRMAPSKALPSFKKYQYRVAKTKFDYLMISKFYYRYAHEKQKQLLEYAKIYAIILNLPKRKYYLNTGNIIKMNMNEFFKRVHSFCFYLTVIFSFCPLLLIDNMLK